MIDLNKYIGKYVVLRCYGSGNHAGFLKAYDAEVRHAILTDTRCIFYWKGAFSLNEVTEFGISTESKLSVKKSESIFTDVLQILPCSELAEKCLQEMETYTP